MLWQTLLLLLHIRCLALSMQEMKFPVGCNAQADGFSARRCAVRRFSASAAANATKTSR